MSKLIFDNNWMRLVVRHGGELVAITDIVDDESQVKAGSSVIAKSFGRLLVAEIPNWVPPTPAKGDGFFIKSDNQFFEIGAVLKDVDEMNGFLKRNEEFAIIATDNQDFSFAVTLRPTFTVK